MGVTQPEWIRNRQISFLYALVKSQIKTLRSMFSKLSNGRTFSKELGLLWVFSINCVGVTKRECLGKSRFSFLYEQVESLKRSIPICMFSRGTEQGQVFLGTRPLRRSGQTGRA